MTYLGLCLSALAVPQAAPFDPLLVPEWESGFEIFVELADWNQDGVVTGAESRELVDWLSGLSEATLGALNAELVLQGLNRDELKKWTTYDVSASFEGLDPDGDGVIEVHKVSLEQLCQGRMGTRGIIHRLAHELLLETADADGDGVVTAAERQSLLKDLGPAVTPDDLGPWIAASKKREPKDRNRMAPGVSFLTLEAGMERGSEGVVDVGAYESWFRAMDANKDGSLTQAERHPPRQAALDQEFWRAPSAERLATPCLMPWQRNLDDALAVQKRTGQALLLCVNMDGETACDSLASWRYRDPAFAEIAAGYVCVVVSPDDHQPRDYDDRGRRLVSPRLGRVTDREHIDLEPTLYRRYFNGRRVAPRHVGVDVDGKILFDLYLINDPASLDAQLREHARAAAPIDWTALDVAELAQYRDASAREEMERRMLDPDPAVRLSAAAHVGSMPEAGVLGLRDQDGAVRDLAARSMAAAGGALDAQQRGRLVAASVGLSEETRALVRAGLMLAVEGDPFAMASLNALAPDSRISALGSAGDWRAAASLSTLTSSGPMGRDEALHGLERLDARIPEDGPTAPQSLLRAQALLRLAEALAAISQDPRDAASEAAAAAVAGAASDPIRAQAIQAQAASLGGDFAGAVRAARAALPSLWAATSDPLYLSTLRALQGGATQLVYAQLNSGQPVASSLVADAMLAGRTLLAHPAAEEADALALLDLAGAVRAVDLVPTLLLESLQRFPASPDLHQRFRAERLTSMGAGAMEAGYLALEAMDLPDGYGPTLMWFRGLALLVAAEWEVAQGADAAAAVLYGSAIAAMEATVESEPAFADSAHHYAVLSHAGSATIAAASGDLAAAARHLEAAGTLRPSSLEQKDGLGRTPRERAAQLLPIVLPALDEARQATLRQVYSE